MSTDSAGVHGHRRVGEPAWRNPVVNQAFNGFDPHTKVVSATERIRSLTERVSRATSGAQHRRKGGRGMTSKKDASLAGKQLASKSATKAQKSVAASDLAQAKGKGKGKKK